MVNGTETHVLIFYNLRFLRTITFKGFKSTVYFIEDHINLGLQWNSMNSHIFEICQ